VHVTQALGSLVKLCFATVLIALWNLIFLPSVCQVLRQKKLVFQEC